MDANKIGFVAVPRFKKGGSYKRFGIYFLSSFTTTNSPHFCLHLPRICFITPIKKKTDLLTFKQKKMFHCLGSPCNRRYNFN